MKRNKTEIKLMRQAGIVVASILETLKEAVEPGVTTIELDAIAREVLRANKAKSNFLGYHGFPAVICTSINNEIVHGIPSNRELKAGDIVSIDAGAIVEGYHGDAAITVGVGQISELAKKLIQVTEASLYIGIDQLQVGNHLFEVGRAIQKYVEANGFSVVREYVGHGIGTKMHEDPQIPNYWPGVPGPLIEEGNVFAIEPMVNAGSFETVLLKDGWTVVTKDGSLSAHFEHSIAVTKQGPEILTVK